MTCRVHLMWLQNLKIPKDPLVDAIHELIKVVVDQEFVKPDGHASDILSSFSRAATAAALPATADFAARPVWCVPQMMTIRR